MAFGDSVMAKFSEESVVLDPAYESLTDDYYSEMDYFMTLVTEGVDYDPLNATEEDEVMESFENMTPNQKFRSYCKMVNNNPRFTPERRKQMIEDYKRNHPDYADESAGIDWNVYEQASQAADDLLAELVGNSYDSTEYEEPSLDDNAEHSSELGYSMSILDEPDEDDTFDGDSEAKYSADLHTTFTRESALDFDMNYYDNEIRNMIAELDSLS